MMLTMEIHHAASIVLQMEALADKKYRYAGLLIVVS
jgi:hypothetical protein